jgi:hypothetical protein
MATPKDLEQALEIAKAQFQQTDPEVQARRAGAQWLAPEPERHSPKVQIPFMGKRYEILLPEGGVRYQDSDTEPASWEKIILLHYMCRADGSRLTGEYISFREIPEGRIYVSTFERRAVAPLLGQYGIRRPFRKDTLVSPGTCGCHFLEARWGIWPQDNDTF